MVEKRLAILMLSPFIALALTIAISIALSRWWSFVDNALSDLGNPSNGLGAIAFNAGLAIVGYLFLFSSLLIVWYRDRAEAIILSTVSLFIVLVAVLNISFGIAHFVVSACLFVSLAIFISYHMLRHRSIALALGLALSIIAWILHFVYRIPKGAAIPETISIAAATLCYTRYTLKR